MDKKEKEVLKFIDDFRDYGDRVGTKDLFQYGYCYWFAYILKGRFPEAKLMYDPIVNHFMVDIDGKQYDINGDMTDMYECEPWSDFDDRLEKERIERYCIRKEDPKTDG